MKRGRDQGEGGDVFVPSSDAPHVAAHYSGRANQSREEREGSVIFRLRGFNNWIKSVLIALYSRPGMKVLDLCGGKGGDLAKFREARVSHYILADVADGSVSHALERYNVSRTKNFKNSHHFPGLFVAVDCFGQRLSDHLDPAIAFDMVSCQFAFHYALESEERLRMALRNVTDRLKPGGLFLGTVPNSHRLVKLIRSVPGLTWSNSICKLQFDSETDKDFFPDFGARYTFALADAVDHVPEYLVHFTALQAVAKDFDLELVLKEEFPDFYKNNVKEQRFKDLLNVMNVDYVSPDEWQAASLYVVFCFRKKGELQVDPAQTQYNHAYDKVMNLLK